MVIHLIRHAHAGRRREWTGDDELRPLSDRGRAQARVIAQCLEGAGIDQFMSSRFLRCLETLEPLAEGAGLTVAQAPALAEGATGGAALDLLLAAAGRGHRVGACSHGDVIPAVIDEAVARGAVLDGPPTVRKGARYQLHLAEGCVSHITHVKRPTADR